MRVYTHIPRCPAQTLPLPIWDMLFRLWIPVLLRHPEIYHMDRIGSFGVWSADEEIVRFDIPVYEVLFVYNLYSG